MSTATSWLSDASALQLVPENLVLGSSSSERVRHTGLLVYWDPRQGNGKIELSREHEPSEHLYCNRANWPSMSKYSERELANLLSTGNKIPVSFEIVVLSWHKRRHAQFVQFGFLDSPLAEKLASCLQTKVRKNDDAASASHSEPTQAIFVPKESSQPDLIGNWAESMLRLAGGDEYEAFLNVGTSHQKNNPFWIQVQMHLLGRGLTAADMLNCERRSLDRGLTTEEIDEVLRRYSLHHQ
jgi:hypothetical protein